jgi:sugar lactone lactonase YvrE
MSPPAEVSLEAGWDAVVVTLAGDGRSGMRDGDAGQARFSDPFGIASRSDGSLYIADAGDAQRIRRIAPDGTVSTLAGSERGFADGPSAFARFDTPSGVAIDPGGAVYVADTANNAIRRITRDGVVSTIAGNGAAGYRDGVGMDALFNGPVGVTVDGTGRVLVADTYNDRIRAIELDGRVITIAGSGRNGLADGPSAEADFDTPCGVAVDAAGNVYVADTGNGAVRMLSAGQVTTLMSPPDGLLRPAAVAVSAAGTVYVTDDRGRVGEITSSGARIVAGSQPGFADGPASDARFRGLAGVTLASSGRLVVTDPRNALIRLVTSPSRADMRPPAPAWIAPRLDTEAFVRAPLVWPLVPLTGPFEITGTLGESRGGEGAERFHAGLDVQASEGTMVRAVRPGVVTDPAATSGFGSLNESVRVGPVTYVHLRAGRERGGSLIDTSRFVPSYDDAASLVRIRVKRGARFDTGQSIGTVNAFNHVHLNIGWPGEEINPLAFHLVQFADTIPPTITRGGIRLFNETGEPIVEKTKRRLVIAGKVQIVVDAWDQVDGNERRRRLGLYRLGYQVLTSSGAPAPGFETPRETIRFDRLSPAADARMIFWPGSGIPEYGSRRTRFLYVVSNSVRDGVSSTGVWDTAALPPGDYTLRILAADIRGNEAVFNRDLPVTIVRRVGL